MSGIYSAKASLPEAFWAQNFDALGIDPPLQFLYAEIVARLKEENDDADTLELMLIERVALLYILIRHREAAQSFQSDRSYKDIFQLWATMAADLRKQRVHQETSAQLKEQILSSVQNAVMIAVKGLPTEIKKEVQQRLLDELEEVGI
jgi:hypothetical protein